MGSAVIARRHIDVTRSFTLEVTPGTPLRWALLELPLMPASARVHSPLEVAHLAVGGFAVWQEKTMKEANVVLS